jgi:hypothetical protein
MPLIVWVFRFGSNKMLTLIIACFIDFLFRICSKILLFSRFMLRKRYNFTGAEDIALQ